MGSLPRRRKTNSSKQFEEGGEDGPRYGGTRVCWAESEEEAHQTAYEWWPNTALKGGGQELSVPPQFEEAVQMVSKDDVAKAITAGPKPEPSLEEIEKYVDAGFDRVYLHQTGPRQEEFIDFAERELVPAVG